MRQLRIAVIVLVIAFLAEDYIIEGKRPNLAKLKSRSRTGREDASVSCQKKCSSDSDDDYDWFDYFFYDYTDEDCVFMCNISLGITHSGQSTTTSAHPTTTPSTTAPTTMYTKAPITTVPTPSTINIASIAIPP